MRIAATYTSYVQRNNHPSFSAAPKRISKLIDYMQPKSYKDLPPMSKAEQWFLAGLVSIPTLATIGVFLTNTGLCNYIPFVNACFGKH